MPTAAAAVVTCQPTNEKMRKEATASDNDETCGPQKKRARKLCSADGCTNYAQRGGVCIKHGAQLKRCSSEGCTNQVVKGGVCIKHGAQLKRCSSEGCTNIVVKGGVCIKHGAQVIRYECSAEGCTNQARKRGFCYRHRDHSDHTPRANFQVVNDLGRDDGNTSSATQSSDDDAGGTQPHGVDRKRKATANQSKKLTSNKMVGDDDGGEYVDRTANANLNGLRFTHGTNRPFHPNQNYYQYQHFQQQHQLQQRMLLAANSNGLCFTHSTNRPFHPNQNYYQYQHFQQQHQLQQQMLLAANSNGLCFTHGTNRPFHPNQNYYQYEHFQQQHQLQQQMLPAAEIISDDEDGEKKQSPIARRKQEVVVDKQSETSISNDAGNEAADESEQEIAGNKEAVPEREIDKPDISSAGRGAKLRDDEEQEVSDIVSQRRARGDDEKATSDGAPTQDGGQSNAMEDSDNWCGDGQNEYDCEDINGNPPGELSNEETEYGANLEQGVVVEKSPELMEPNNRLRVTNEIPKAKEIIHRFEGAQTRSECESNEKKLGSQDLQKRLKDLMSELKERSDTQKRSELLWSRKEEELNSQIKTSVDKLKEANNQVEELSTEIIALKTILGEAERNDAFKSAKLVEMANDFEIAKALSESTYEDQRSIIRQKSETASILKEMLRSKEEELNDHMQASAEESERVVIEVATLNTKLAEATRNEASLSAQLMRMTNDFAATRARAKSVHEQQQSTIEDLRAKLKEKESELRERSETAARLAADSRSKEAEMITQIQTSADKLKEAASDVDAMKARLREASTNEEALNERLKRMRDEVEAAKSMCEKEKATNDELRVSLRDMKSELLEQSESLSKFEAQLRNKEAEMTEMARDVALLKANLAEANNSMVLLGDQLKRAVDDFEANRASYHSKIDELSARLTERESELIEKFDTTARLAADSRSKEGETIDLAALNVELNTKLPEGSDVAKLKTMEETQAEVETLKGALDIVKAEVSALKKKNVSEESTTNSPQRAQSIRRMNMKCRHDEALAKEVAEKNRVQKQLDALLAKKQKEVCSEENATLRTDSSSRYPSRHRSYETRSRSQQSGVGSTSAAIDQTSPQKKQASGSRNSKSNPRGSLVTIKDGGFVGESRRKTARESKKGEIINAKLRAELLDVLASTKNISKVSLDDIIGQEVAKKAMLELKPFLDPEYACLYADDEDSEEDSKSNTGILLFGPPGTGKTMFAKAMASNGGCIFFKISPDDILRKHVGESEERMRGFFLIAKEKAVETGKTAVLFIDECDRLFKEPGNNDCEVTGNITGIFQECMNGITEPKGQLIFLGATNYKEKLPSPILSRFAIKIPINLPDREERIAIAKRNMTSIHSLTDDEFDQFAEMTDGYSGRDIYNLIKRGAEPSRKLEAKEHSGAWCKNNNDCYVPCFHSPDHPCRAKERGTFREIKKRTKTENVRPRLLALKHIEMGINLLGRPEQMFQE